MTVATALRRADRSNIEKYQQRNYIRRHKKNGQNPETQQRQAVQRKEEVEDAPSSSCISMGWHPDMVNKNGCTDDINIDKEWLEPGMREFFLFESADECCAAFNLGNKCQVYESGCLHEDGDAVIMPDSLPEDATISSSEEALTLPSEPQPCRSIGWHPDLTNKDGCSNDDNIWEDWAKPSNHGVWIFDTPEECCAIFRQPNQECQIYESECIHQDPNDLVDALGSDCEGDLPWHPNFETRDSFGCSNKEVDVVPDGFELHVYDSARECCNNFHDDSGDCPVVDVCSEGNDAVYLPGVSGDFMALLIMFLPREYSHN